MDFLQVERQLQPFDREVLQQLPHFRVLSHGQHIGAAARLVPTVLRITGHTELYTTGLNLSVADPTPQDSRRDVTAIKSPAPAKGRGFKSDEDTFQQEGHRSLHCLIADTSDL